MVVEKKIGRYEVVSVLGRGAMGTVYEAVDPVIERTVAIKTISLDLSARERAEFEERFYREAKSAGRLSHPNIVTIYDVGETNDVAYIAMEFLEGETLRELLDTGVVLPLAHISKIAARIASALNYAHDNHVVHRDIKPANIMIARNRDIKIMDFGIAKIATDSRTLDGTVLGSPKYMAPEQIVGQPTDGRTDIFALGAMLYEMLTGVAPFSGDNLNAIMYKIMNEEPTPPSALTARVPPAFDRIVAKALAKKPEDRYQTAREFASDLRNSERAANAEGREPGRKVARPKPPLKVVPVTRNTPADATVLLAPRAPQPQPQPVMAKKVSDIELEPPPRRWTALLPSRRNLFLFSIPALMLVAFAIFMRTLPPPHSMAPARNLPVAAEARVAVAPAASSAGAASGAASAPEEISAAGSIATAPVVTPPAVATSGIESPGTVGASTVQDDALRATVVFAVAPWGRVFIDGKSVGVSPPLKRLKLSPGSHTVEIRNQGFAPFRDTLTLNSGESLQVRHQFK